MGYSTDLIGHIDINPPLNDHEQAYLAGFAGSRRGLPGQPPYTVPGNPAAEEFDATTASTATSTRAAARYVKQADAVPGPWCGWVPAWSGGCLTYDGKEKFYAPVEWMQYLIDHFLTDGAKAQSSGIDYFEHFTFDHVLDGLVAASRRDTCELFLIDVRESEVTRTVLREGDSQPWELGELPYQEVSDYWSTRRPRKPLPRLPIRPGRGRR